jgi:hypothetical protein
VIKRNTKSYILKEERREPGGQTIKRVSHNGPQTSREREQRAESREQRAESRKQRAESREQRAGSR